MPYLHIRVSGEKDDALATRIADAAVELTATLLGKNRHHTAVVVEFIGANHHWSIAGLRLRDDEPRSYHWVASVTDETNTKTEKARYLRAVHSAMGELLGGVAEVSYAHVADLRGSAYGFGGRTQESRFQQPG